MVGLLLGWRWGWREFKALPASWFDGLARILSKVEATVVWPEGLLDVYIAVIPDIDGDATLLVHRPLSRTSPKYIAFRPLPGWGSWKSGYSLGSLTRSLVLVVVVALMRLGARLLLTLKRSFLEWLTLTFISFVADVMKSFDTVDRGILDVVLSSLGLPGWFRHAHFEYHSHVSCVLSLLLGWVNLGLGTEVFHRVVL